MPDDKGLIEAGAKGVAAGMVEPFRELVQQFLGPFANEVGTGLGYVGYTLRLKFGLKMLAKARKMLEDAGIVPEAVAPKLFLPILENASLEEDESLQERWAALLANAATSGGNSGVHPSFAQILKELTANDAMFLSAILQELRGREPRFDGSGAGKEDTQYVEETFLVGNEASLYDIYAEAGLTRLPLGAALSRGATRAEIAQHKADQRDFQLSVQTLERLRLMVQESDLRGFDENVKSSHYASRLMLDTQRVAAFVEAATAFNYYLTQLGLQFVSACQPPDKQQPH